MEKRTGTSPDVGLDCRTGKEERFVTGPVERNLAVGIAVVLSESFTRDFMQQADGYKEKVEIRIYHGNKHYDYTIEQFKQRLGIL